MRAGRLDDDYKALGLAVSLMMADPSFGRLPFGQWSRILAGQIKRKHYLFASEGKGVTVFLGGALTDGEHAENWLTKRGEISFEAAQDGDCVLINAWLAKSRSHQPPFTRATAGDWKRPPPRLRQALL